MCSTSVLLVEDSPSDALLIKQLLEAGPGASFRLEIEQRLSGAMERAISGAFPVILLDLELPDSQGLETLKHMKIAAPKSAVVVLTRDGDPELAMRTIHEGAQDYLVKGRFDSDLLTRSIRYAVERQRAQSQLTEQANELQRATRRAYFIADQNVDGIVVVDDNGRILYANPAALQMFNMTMEKLMEVPFGFPIVIGKTTEVEILRSGRRPIVVEMRATDIDWDGSHARLASLRDSTEQKLLEAQLRQAQKIEAVGRLAGGIAHDFNNLLCIIIGRSRLLAKKLQSSKEACEELDLMYRTGERGAALTRQLLAFSRLQILEPKVLDLNALVSNMEKMLARLVREDIAISSRLDPALMKVKVDPSQLEQVLMNLVINARDAMEEGGKLTIETTNVELDSAYAQLHPQVTPGKYVMLAVSDTGVGMNKETRARIFEPFFTTKELGKGTGLGLATVYGIVKQSDGHIEVYSELGNGTTIKVYLPGIQGTDIAPSADGDPNVVERGHETVLVAEDEEEIGKLVLEILEQFGYQVLLSSNGRKALDLARKHPGPIHLLLTDVIMPEMNGPDLVRNLMQMRPEMKVLYTSGYTDLATARKNIIQENSAFLAKPYSPASLIAKVQDVLRH